MLIVLQRFFSLAYYNCQSHTTKAWTTLKVKCGDCILIYHLGHILAITWYNFIWTETRVLGVPDQHVINYSSARVGNKWLRFMLAIQLSPKYDHSKINDISFQTMPYSIKSIHFQLKFMALQTSPCDNKYQICLNCVKSLLLCGNKTSYNCYLIEMSLNLTEFLF